jgi:tetratricopeptide (TPR) repeat protein
MPQSCLSALSRPILGMMLRCMNWPILKKVQNDYTGAQPLLERAVAVKPNNEWYWSALADSYEKSNNIGKLENVFNQLIRLNPNKPEYYFDKANAWLF